MTSSELCLSCPISKYELSIPNLRNKPIVTGLYSTGIKIISSYVYPLASDCTDNFLKTEFEQSL